MPPPTRVPLLRGPGSSRVGGDASGPSSTSSLMQAGPPLPYKSGSFVIAGGNGVAGALVQNDENAWPFWQDTVDIATLDSVTINVTTLGATSAVRLGIRPSDTTLAFPYPSSTVTDKGTQATTGTGAVTWSSLAYPVPRRTIVWLTFTEQGGTPPSVTTVNGTDWPQLVDANTVVNARGYKQTGQSGALGAFSATITASTVVPRAVLKWA